MNREAQWVPLLQRLTEEIPSWGVVKNIDAAFTYGRGDIDTSAPEAHWPAVTAAFTDWAMEQRLGPVISCTHPPHNFFLLAVDEERRTFEELDLIGRKFFRGGTLYRAEDLVPLFEIDARGFRRLRPGAEGLLVLLTNGAAWGGRPNVAAIARKSIGDLVSRDPEGIRAAARTFKLPEEPVVDLADAVAGGDWDRRAALRIEASAVGRALFDPRIIARRAWFRGVSKRSCPVLHAVFVDDRQLGEDVDGWLQRVRATHPVVEVRRVG